MAPARRRNRSSDGRGNFGASPKPPRRESKTRRNCSTPIASASGPATLGPDVVSRTRCSGFGRRCRLRHPREQIVGDSIHVRSLALPDARDLLEHLGETGTTPARARRIVGAAVKRLERRRQPDAHRPAAGAGRRLHERHVDAIDVRPFFPVDLDRHEIPVELFGNRRALERFVLHDVAPVARRVPDRKKDRLVFVARLRERGVAPGIPVDGILGVLEQVRAALGREPVGHPATI